jgi:hypothetical protein
LKALFFFLRAFWVAVVHEGNAQVAPEGLEAIRAFCHYFVKGQWRDKDGKVRPLQEGDIMVFAPHNAQMNALRAALPRAIRIGTVDKF